jgi:hypothetical protein
LMFLDRALETEVLQHLLKRGFGLGGHKSIWIAQATGSGLTPWLFISTANARE